MLEFEQFIESLAVGGISSADESAERGQPSGYWIRCSRTLNDRSMRAAMVGAEFPCSAFPASLAEAQRRSDEESISS